MALQLPPPLLEGNFLARLTSTLDRADVLDPTKLSTVDQTCDTCANTGHYWATFWRVQLQRCTRQRLSLRSFAGRRS